MCVIKKILCIDLKFCTKVHFCFNYTFHQHFEVSLNKGKSCAMNLLPE